MTKTMTESEKRMLDRYNDVKRELHTCSPMKKDSLKVEFTQLYLYLHKRGVL